MHSAIYTGQLRHRRFAPRAHEFTYGLFMMYVDLAELDEIFRHRWLWSVKRPALAWLRRADYLGDATISLDQALRDRVAKETGVRPQGPIRMLTHLRYFGVGFNPVTFYYCFDRDDRHVETIVAEITNTPWKERHAYVLVNPTPSLAQRGRVGERALGGERCSVSVSPPRIEGENKSERAKHHRFLFTKSFHVSPFMPMQLDYDWRFSTPGERLTVHMQNMRGDAKLFDATLDVQRREITGAALAHVLTAFPLMTLKVIGGIHWQALKLRLKRVPFHAHPNKSHDHERDARTPSIS